MKSNFVAASVEDHASGRQSVIVREKNGVERPLCAEAPQPIRKRQWRWRWLVAGGGAAAQQARNDGVSGLMPPTNGQGRRAPPREMARDLFAAASHDS